LESCVRASLHKEINLLTQEKSGGKDAFSSRKAKNQWVDIREI
jgi:hypothetical protein